MRTGKKKNLILCLILKGPQSSLYPGAIDDLPISTALGALVIQAQKGREKEANAVYRGGKVGVGVLCNAKKTWQSAFFRSIQDVHGRQEFLKYFFPNVCGEPDDDVV